MRETKGFTLLELVIAGVLFAVVLVAASNLLISFGNFSSNLVKSEASLMGTALGAFEQITGKIEAANKVAINGSDVKMDIPDTDYQTTAGCAGNSCLQIRVSPTGAGASSDHSHDAVYTYWQQAAVLNSQSKLWDSTNSVWNISNVIPIASDIDTLTFVRPDAVTWNRITVTLDTHAHSGTGSDATSRSTEHLVTTAIMRSKGMAS